MRDRLVRVHVFLIPWKRNIVFSLCGNVVSHEFVTFQIADRFWFWKSPRQWCRLYVVRSLKASRCFDLLLLLVVDLFLLLRLFLCCTCLPSLIFFGGVFGTFVIAHAIIGFKPSRFLDLFLLLGLFLCCIFLLLCPIF